MSALPDPFLNLLRARRSVRRFTGRPVPRAMLEQLIEAAGWAPSAGNRQDWFFIVAGALGLKTEMGEIVRRHWDSVLAANCEQDGGGELAEYVSGFDSFASAPALVAVCARKLSEIQRRLLGVNALVSGGSLISAAMAAQNLMLAAHALGLGTCCMTGALAAREELEKILNVGRRHELICLVTVGFPAEEPSVPACKTVGEIARFME